MELRKRHGGVGGLATLVSKCLGCNIVIFVRKCAGYMLK